MAEPIVMPEPPSRSLSLAHPADWAERELALDTGRSFLVQAPAGSGKTYLLTQRFLRLLGEVRSPDEIVAITFTKAAAAEMRNRILGELERAEAAGRGDGDAVSLASLAWRALERGRGLGWAILDQPAQLRITTIDAFCRGMALLSPLQWGMLSGLGGRLEMAEDPKELYRRAARRTIASIGASGAGEAISGADRETRQALERLLLWRDNSWKDFEDRLIEMLAARNRWFQGFVFDRSGDWEALRARLEGAFRRAARAKIAVASGMLDGLEGSREEVLKLARFACVEPGKSSPMELVARAGSLQASGDLAEAVEAFRCLAGFLLTNAGGWRSPGGLTKHHGFPAGPKGAAQKARFGELVDGLEQEPGLREALGSFLKAVPVGYTDEEWGLVRDCFAVLRRAAAELQLVFAETGMADFTEVAQIALRVLMPPDEGDGFPSDFAMQYADGIRHLLVDEFQDTSRSQHQLLSRLIAAWPEREGRSCFFVGDPMQSIYGFREAEVELFERVKMEGLEIPGAEALPLEGVRLRANFRTEPSLVEDLNRRFALIFAEDDGSGVEFAAAAPARPPLRPAKTELHWAFTASGRDSGGLPGDPEGTRREQLAEMVALIREHVRAMEGLRASGQVDRYRIAVLGRTRKTLVVVAEALRAAGIGFRAIELVPLRERPEVVDALALARALLNPADRTAWLGVLRAPWCGLSLAELHLLTSADDAAVMGKTIPDLLQERLPGLRNAGRLEARGYEAAQRVGQVLRAAVAERAGATTGLMLGTWLESVWKRLGGEDTIDAGQGENLRLLWSCLDGLPGGEVDLLGPALGASLGRLFALPDPAASSDFGVQLMTIHKSKGLEFEVVLVPDLEAANRNSKQEMVSWLERGLATRLPSGEDGRDGEISEFLIAPIQSKGEDAGAAKAWVDGVRQQRETQEMRRLFYVAATRARQELHLFARPRFSVKDGEYSLAKPTRSLLATAWAALEDEAEAAFAEWVRGLDAAPMVPTLAASGEFAGEAAGNLRQMAGTGAETGRADRATRVRRLPLGYVPPADSRGVAGVESAGGADEPLFARTEGGLESRLVGIAVHSLLERLSQLRERLEPGAALLELAGALPRVVAAMRERGVTFEAAQRLAERALAVTRRAASDPAGAWILAPHAGAVSEAAWTGLVRGRQWNLRPDRVFFAAAEPESEACWWIIDYKTSDADGLELGQEGAEAGVREAFLQEHRERFGGQLAVYAQVWAQILAERDGGNRRSGAGSRAGIRVGIYYPALSLLDTWKA